MDLINALQQKSNKAKRQNKSKYIKAAAGIKTALATPRTLIQAPKGYVLGSFDYSSQE